MTTILEFVLDGLDIPTLDRQHAVEASFYIRHLIEKQPLSGRIEHYRKLESAIQHRLNELRQERFSL
ncbi:hypothetical protein H7F15_05850 [Pontibacter sp. Tf4]|uniref:hypothetical protein n=1 Tax=Pontibacter sp. Tf4 TaxID=2761620 RepID=UPI0016244870|nr:hypothetical protein [Pontibacter sp. Tf4]MBB6610552.1 hypothetical protein [Pontibacter sp. Tf4]